MPDPSTLVTGRLILRPWREADFVPYAAINADPRVMEHYPKTLTRAESDAGALRIKARFEEQGWGLWAMELRATGTFVGFTGLQKPPFEAHFTPCVEIGWRVAFAHWGQGLAPEAARAALAYGFEDLGLTEIVAMTATQNLRSMRVMEKIGMTRDPADDFDIPVLPEGHRLRRHVLYRTRGIAPGR
jgi:RimJ/RimL family protein N-acetyltransferase